MADTPSPTPTREEVVAWLTEFVLHPATTRTVTSETLRYDRCARAALAMLAPDPWGEGDAALYEQAAKVAEEETLVPEGEEPDDLTRDALNDMYALRRAAQRARGITPTEDGR